MVWLMIAGYVVAGFISATIMTYHSRDYHSGCWDDGTCRKNDWYLCISAMQTSASLAFVSWPFLALVFGVYFLFFGGSKLLVGASTKVLDFPINITAEKKEPTKGELSIS